MRCIIESFHLPVAAVAISLRYASAASFFGGFCLQHCYFFVLIGSEVKKPGVRFPLLLKLKFIKLLFEKITYCN